MLIICEPYRNNSIPMPTKNASIWKLTKNLPDSFLVFPSPYENSLGLILSRIFDVDYCFFLPTNKSVQFLYDKIRGDCYPTSCSECIKDHPVFRIDNIKGVGSVTMLDGEIFQFEHSLGGISISMRKWIQRLSTVEDCVCYDMKTNQVI